MGDAPHYLIAYTRGDVMKYPFDLQWQKSFEDFCLENHIYLAHVQRTRGVYREGEIIRFFNSISTEAHASMPIRSFCSIGCHSYSASHLPSDLTVGRYTSIAPGVKVMGTQHPTDRFTSSPMTYAHRFINIAREDFSAEWRLRPFRALLPAPKVGNDVWIGEDVTIKGGISIGDGAIIASRALVTRDVPPYCIVGGVPAKVIRYRFSELQIERLLSTKWWNYNFVDLPDQTTWDHIEQFLDALELSIAEKKIAPYCPPKIDLSAEFWRLANPAAVVGEYESSSSRQQPL